MYTKAHTHIIRILHVSDNPGKPYVYFVMYIYSTLVRLRARARSSDQYSHFAAVGKSKHQFMNMMHMRDLRIPMKVSRV